MSTPAPAADRTAVTLGTATPGGGFPVYGEAFAEAIHAADPTLEIRQRNTKGSTENVPLLERGEVDLALVQGEVAYEAIMGVGRAPADLRILTAMYSTPGMFVVRADSPRPLGLVGSVPWGWFRERILRQESLCLAYALLLSRLCSLYVALSRESGELAPTDPRRRRPPQYLFAIGSSSAGKRVMIWAPPGVTMTSSSMRAADTPSVAGQ